MTSNARSVAKFSAGLLVIAALVVLAFAEAKQYAGSSYGNQRLAEAIDADDLRGVAGRIQAGDSVEQLDFRGRTPLAASLGRPEITKYLLQHGANPNTPLPTGETLLARAALEGNVEMIRDLVQNGARVEATDAEGSNALLIAIQNNQLEASLELLRDGAKPTCADSIGSSPLHYAAGRNNPELVRALINAGANVNAKTYLGITPLDRAVLNGRLESYELLASHGGKSFDHDYSLMHLAALAGAMPTQLQLIITPRLNYHFSPEQVRATETSYSRVSIYAQERSPQVIMALAKRGYPINARGKAGLTPLHIAALGNSGPAVTAFLKLGADPNIRDAQGKTAKQLALEKKCDRALAALTTKR